MKAMPYFKAVISLTILVISATTLFGQNALIKIGRRTDCSGRGICSIITFSNNTKNDLAIPNATFIHSKTEAVILRIFRNQLTKNDEDRLLSRPSNTNSEALTEFILYESLEIIPNFQYDNTGTEIKALINLKAKGYPVSVTKDVIDIILHDPLSKD